MGRTVAEIQEQINGYLAANPALAGLNSPSQASYYENFINTIAIELAYEEQLRDQFQVEITADLFDAPPGTPQWMVQQCLIFQYSAGTPQVVALDLATFRISYPVINTAYQVISQAAVLTNPNKEVLVKVSPLDPTTVFDGTASIPGNNSAGTSGPTMSALSTYLDLINFAGVEFTIINAYPDLFLIGANIFYNGQFAPFIQSTVPAAISNYLSSLPFNGYITLNGSASNPGLIDAIMAVPGVLDVDFTNVSIRPWSYPVSEASLLVENSQTIYRNWGTFSGRAVSDTANQGTSPYILNYTIQY